MKTTPRQRIGRALLISALLSNMWLAIPGATHLQTSSTREDAATKTNAALVNVESRAGEVIRLTGVTAKNGILAFDSLETYEKSYPIIFSMSAEQSQSWEKSLGFVSQRNIFNQIVEAEYEYLLAPYENKSNEELKRMAPPAGHTDIYYKYLQSGLIRIQRDASGEETYTSAIPIGGYLPIVNEQGYFIVGDTIYQVKKDLIKEMTGFEFSKISTLDKASSESAAGKIKVLRVVENSPAESSKAAASCSYPLDSGWQTIGKRRGKIYVNFTKSYWNPYPHTRVTISYEVNVKSQKKNFWGNWVYASCPNECWIDLTWTGVFEYISKVTLGYAGSTISPRSYSYPHPNCINDFKTSLSPITGSIAPYPSSFIFTAPSGRAFLDVRLSNALWHASVPGGSSGITCNVSCP
jgi:hypothetical protein